MRPWHTLIAGMATGGTVGLTLVLVTRIGNPMYHWTGALATLVLIPLTASLAIRFLFGFVLENKPRKRVLIPVAYATELIPVLGPVFGASGNWSDVPIIMALGMVGGIIWSLLFVLLIYFAPKPPYTSFKNPQNDYTEESATPLSWLWVFLFGPLYWIVRGVWTHAIAHLVLALITLGIAHLIYPFFTYSILRKSYLTKGWVQVDPVEN